MTVTAGKYLQKKVRWIIDLVQHEKMVFKRWEKKGGAERQLL